jgi:hypothetical protein
MWNRFPICDRVPAASPSPRVGALSRRIATDAQRTPNRDPPDLVRNRPRVLAWALEPVPGSALHQLNEEMT